LGSSRRCAGHNFRIRAWLCHYRLKFRNLFHVGPYAAPAEAVRRSFEELSCGQHRRKARCGKGSNQTSRVRQVGPGIRLGTQRASRTNPHRLRFT
jgi:hypothetical protein